MQHDRTQAMKGLRHRQVGFERLAAGRRSTNAQASTGPRPYWRLPSCRLLRRIIRPQSRPQHSNS